MATDDSISYVVNFLKNHEYPLLNSIPLEEVFAAANVSFLVSWAFCLWHKDRFEAMLDNREEDKAFIAELIHCYGFCSDVEEAQQFLSAEQTPEEQIFLIYRMFKIMEPTIRTRLADDEQVLTSITDADLDNFQHKDVNPFPEFGNIVSLTDEERHEKLKAIIISSKKLCVEDEKVVLNCKLPQWNTDISSVDESLTSFKQSMSEFKRLETLQMPPKFATDNNFGDLLKYCNSTLQDLSKYFDTLKTAQQIKVENLELPEDDLSHFVSSLYQNCIKK
ncbi:hypothetical protein D910_05601 [Dendroctonus ponderosae]|uniref:Uncharacterized protein n=1 Tax=Dendroctonus ponderosae TaxID=77166 RepID=U4U790_DENPD|nr:hypothetical protein D910_05601 [Dendroctonus ponderosae]